LPPTCARDVEGRRRVVGERGAARRAGAGAEPGQGAKLSRAEAGWKIGASPAGGMVSLLMGCRGSSLPVGACRVPCSLSAVLHPLCSLPMGASLL
jgi:hypothetical protein